MLKTQEAKAAATTTKSTPTAASRLVVKADFQPRAGN